jgi:hypothetical protein
MRRDLADPGQDPAARDLADLDRDLADLGRGLAAQDLADRELDRTDRGDLVERDLAARGRTDRRDRGDLVERDLAARGRTDRGERGRVARDRGERDRVARDRVERDRVDQDRVDRVGRDRADQDRVDRVGRGRADRDLGRGLADRCRGALTIGVMPRWVVPRMRLAASAHTTTARHLRHKQGDSAGTMGLLPVGRRLTGSGRRLQVVGTVLRLPVVGTTRGTGRSAALSRRKATSGRAITAATPPFRSSIRFSVDGASGTSVSGFRCTDAT